MHYSIAKLSINISDNLSDGIWRPWQYKMDPYKTGGENSSDSHLFIDRWNKEEPAPVALPALHIENSGLFSHRICPADIGGYIFAYTRNVSGIDYIQYYVSETYEHACLVKDLTETGGIMAFEYLTRIMPAVFLKYGILTFHGVLLEDEGRGIVISAPSGTGKTTHARLWRNVRNSLIINGDRATCYVSGGRWIGCGIPWSGTSGEQVNRSVPLSAVVVLERSKNNRVEKLYGMDVFSALFPNMLMPKWNINLTASAMDLLELFLEKIPVYRLYCRPDSEAVEVLERALRDVV